MKWFVLFLITFADPVFAELFNNANNPNNFNRIAGINLIRKFDALPAQGGLSDSRLGWSESYWPSNKGGIAYRWNHPDPQPFKYRLHTKEEVRSMSENELSKLSPAELYDISNDDYKYTLTRKTLKKFSPRDLWWEGICHGWAQAASHYPEPAPVVVTSKSGVKVPFGASVSNALPRRVMVAGTKHAISFAATMNKTEPMRDPTDFGDIMRGLSIYGRKVIKPEALTTALVGA